MSKKQEQDNRARNDFSFPKEWTVYGPVGKADPEPDFAVMTDIPKELSIAGRQLAGQKAVFTDNYLDLGALLGGKAVGKTAYLLATVTAERDMDATFGAGADWWMKWWVNGAVVCDTTAEGNISWPPASCNRRFSVRLKPGGNIIAVKVASGVGSFVLAACGARALGPCTWLGLTEQAALERLAASNDLRDRLELSAAGLMAILDPEKELMPTRGYEVAHDLGRWWDAALRLEETIGFVIPADLEAASLRNLERLTDNPDRLLTNRSDVPWLRDKAKINPHNFRETLLAFGGLVRRRRSLWAYDAGLQLARTMGHILDGDGRLNYTRLGSWGSLPMELDIKDRRGEWFDGTGSSGRALEALVWFYEETGCNEILDVAARIAALHLANTTNPDGSMRAEIVDPEHNGHNHSYHGTLRGLLLFGLLTGQRQYVETVEATYRKAVRCRIVRESGWAPHDLGKPINNNEYGDPSSDPASAGDSAQLALWLALRAGCDDLLDDVERLVRARLLPSQCTEAAFLLAAGGRTPREVGAWCIHGHSHAGKGCHPDVHAAVIHTLCDVYRNILTRTAAGVRVNLHFNAENEWLRTTTTRSGREARLNVRVKRPENIWIRIPGYTPEASLRLTVDGQTLTPRRMGVFSWVPASALKVGSEIALVYNLPERQTEEKMPSGRTYTFAWRGDEIVGVSPQEDWMPFYPELEKRGEQL